MSETITMVQAHEAYEAMKQRKASAPTNASRMHAHTMMTLYRDAMNLMTARKVTSISRAEVGL